MIVNRLSTFGESIFSEITQLANAHGAINLGQGFPDEDGPQSMLDRACQEIHTGNNQYAPARGFTELREAVAKDRSLRGHQITADNVLITVGATEAISASLLGLVESESEVIVLEPYYDAYAAAIALAGAHRVAVPLKATENGWQPDISLLEKAITPRSRMIIINSPHNPTGSVFTLESLRAIAELAIKNDLLVLSDEVYEQLVFPPAHHIPVATLPGMKERTITVSSAAKTLNVTGWKTGWAIASPWLMEGISGAKQFLTFVGGSPFQPAVAEALIHEQEWIDQLRTTLKLKRDYLAKTLTKSGFSVYPTFGTYYIVADISQVEGHLGVTGADEFCRVLTKDVGVAAIPITAFADTPSTWNHLVRFAFCKRWEVLESAVERLKVLKSSHK